MDAPIPARLAPMTSTSAPEKSNPAVTRVPPFFSFSSRAIRGKGFFVSVVLQICLQPGRVERGQPAPQADDDRLADNKGRDLRAEMAKPRLAHVKAVAGQRHDRAEFVVGDGDDGAARVGGEADDLDGFGGVVVEGDGDQRVARSDAATCSTRIAPRLSIRCARLPILARP